MADSVSTNDLKRGMVLELDGDLFQIVEFQHHKPGKGQAVVRTKIRNVQSGAVLDKTFNSDTKVSMARLDHREMQHLYADDDRHVFMDNETFEQTHLTSDQIGEGVRFLTEGVNVKVSFHEETPVSVDMPITVDLRITETEPGLKGDRQSAGTKPATVETGAQVHVPLFVDVGEVVRIDTRNGEYVTRVQD